MPDKGTDTELEHCSTMRKWAEDNPQPGCFGVDICWLDWATEEYLIRKKAQNKCHG